MGYNIDEYNWFDKHAELVLNYYGYTGYKPKEVKVKFKLVDQRLIDQNGTHWALYIEDDVYKTGFKMQLSHIFWEIKEHENEFEAIKYFTNNLINLL